MAIPLRLLIIESSEEEALLKVRELQKAGYDPVWCRVDSPEAVAEKLANGPWDLILSAFTMPGFGGLEVLAMVREKDPDLAFIFITQGIGEEAAVQAIKAGACDCILKEHLDRLPAAVAREQKDSERRRSKRAAEADQRQKNAFYADMAAKACDGIVVTDLNARIKDCNKSFLDIIGIERVEDARGLSLLDITPPEYHERERALVREQACKRGYTDLFEKEYVRPDGLRIPVSVRIRMLCDAEGKPVEALGLARDITDEKSAKRALEESARLHRLLTESSTDVIWSCDLDLNLHYVSPSVETLLGWTPAEVIDTGIARILTPDSLLLANDKLRTAMHRHQSGKRVSAPLMYEIEQNRKNGSTVWTEVSASLFFDDDGKVAGISGATRDISERKKAEIALRQAKEDWERTFDGVPDLIAIIDSEHRIVRANRAMARQLGLTPEECVGRLCYDSVHGDSGVPDFCPHARSMSDGREHAVEVHEERLGGDFLVSCTPLFDDRGGRIGSVHVARDITENKRAAEALRRSEEKFRSIFVNTLIGIFQASLEGRFITVNPAFARLFGYESPEDLISSVTDIGRQIFADPADRENVITGLKSSGCLERFFVKVRKKDGSNIWVALNACLVRDKAGAILFVEGMVEDITTRKRWEEALAESDRFSKEIITHANEGVIVCDRDLQYVVWNRFMENLTGVNSRDVLGRRATDLFPHIREHGIEQLMHRALRGVTASSADTPFQVPQTGKTGWVQSTYSPHVNARGEIVGVIGMIRDVTERKKTEDSLRQSERRLDLALKGSGLAFWDLNVRTGDAIFDERWAEILGYPVSELTSNLDAWRKSLHPDDLSRAMAELMDHLEGRKSDYYAEYRIRTRSGSWKWIADSGKAYEWDDEGKPLRAAGTHLDITGRKQAEKALRESETRFRQLIENAPEGIFVQTRGRFAYLNNAALRVFGARSRDEIIGQPLIERIHPDYHAAVKERTRILNEEKRAVPPQDQVYLRLDGTLVDVSVSVVPMRYEGDDGALAFIRDISERKQAEESLKQSEVKYRSIFENAAEGIYQASIEGRFLSVNPAFARMFGYDSPEDAIQSITNISGRFMEPADRQRNIEILDKNDVLKLEEFKLRCKDGHTIWCRLNARAVRDDAGKIRLIEGMIEDITEKKKAEEALRESLAKREELEAIISQSPIVVVLYRMEKGYPIEYASPSVIQYGYEPEDFTSGRIGFLDVVHPDDVDRIVEEARMNFQMGCDDITQDYRIRTAWGDYQWVLNRTRMRRDRNGRVTHGQSIIHDITDRKRAEIALQESERQMRALLDNIPDIVWLKDADSRFIAVNEPFGRTCGAKPEELVGKRDIDIWPKELAEAYRADDQEVMQSGRTKRVEEPLEDAHGKQKWIETIKTPIRNERGNIIGTTGIARDITERKHMEEHYRMLSDKSLAGVYLVQDGVFKYLNANAASYAGFSPEELVGSNSTILLHPEDRAIAQQRAGEMIRGVRQTPYEFRIIDKAGKTRWILETVTTIPYEGRPAVLGNSMDITQFKEAQQKLEELQALESSVLAAIPHAVIGLEHRHVIFANDNVETVFGWKPSEIIGKDLAVFFSSEAACETLIGHINQTLQTGSVYSAEPENPLVHREGRPLYSRVTAARIGSGAGEGVVATFEDVTERKRAQLQLLQSEKMASIGQLAAGVAHEINNPTGYVSSNLKTMAEYFDDIMGILQRHRQFLNGVRDLVENAKLDGDLPGLMREIENMEKKIDIEYILKDAPSLIQESREGTERIKEIVLSLKNFAHPGEDRFIYSDVNRNMESTLNVVWNELKYKATVNKDYGELPEIQCYPQQVNQVFMNILVNAAQAIKTKGEITIRTRSINGDVEISINDTGVGIPPEHLARVFDPFFTTKEVGKGTGLGLNVAYNIIKKHHGSIDVTSKLGEGTTFTIRLPVHQEEGRA